MNLKFWQRSRPATVPVDLSEAAEADWKRRVLPAFKRQLANVTPADDPLLAGCLGLIDANLRVELGPAIKAGLSDADRHRFAGRLGMLLDLKTDLLRLQLEAVQERRKEQAKG